jgi:hypothetical protein
MINFRFHIVSLTAVLLALGIGLMLGTTFLDTATVDYLNRQLEDLEGRLADVRRDNEQLNQRLDTDSDEQAAFNEQIGARLFRGQLTDVPVLVITTQGVDAERVGRVTDALTDAGADYLGTWWLSERLRLDDENEVSDLGEALELTTTDAERLRENLASQLGDVLFAATDAPAAPAAGAPAPPEPTEPPIVARLREGGFVEYERPEGVDDRTIALPPGGVRVVVVSGSDAGVPPGQVVVPVLIDLSNGGPVPAVAVEPSIVPPEEGDDDAEPPESLVVDVREDSDLKERISTVDDLDRVSGLAATVLAVADADPADPTIGHYGLGDGAQLLPPPPEEDG